MPQVPGYEIEVVTDVLIIVVGGKIIGGSVVVFVTSEHVDEVNGQKLGHTHDLDVLDVPQFSIVVVKLPIL